VDSQETSRKLRVLSMVDGLGITGGGELLARRIAERLDAARYERTLCVTRWQPQPEYEAALGELDRAGVEFLGLRRGSRLDMRPWRTVLRRLRRARVDILHTHKFGSNVWGAALASLSRVPVFVAHEHTWSYSGDRLRVLADRRLIAARADAFIAVSGDDQRKMVEIERIPPEKVRLIPNGIDMAPARPEARTETREALGLTVDQPVIGTVAALRAQKALDVLIEAVALLRPQFPELVALIVGGTTAQPDETERLSAVAKQVGVDSAVRFLGRRSDIPELLAAMDIALTTSDYEGSPLSVMEYMEAGLPVVATRVGGVPDIVVDGETGVIVPPRDPAAVAREVARLLEHADEARRMGAAGRSRRRAEFDLAVTVRRVEELYEELYERNAMRAR
jgi:glycosyltransferase involved in cell wall biosynthesis